MEALEDGPWEGVADKVCVLDGGTAFAVDTCHRDVDERATGDHERAAALYHRHRVAVLEVVLRDVVRGIAAADYDGFFACAGGLRADELRGVEDGAVEGEEARDGGWEVCFAAGAGGLDYMAWVECACWG